MPIHHSLKTLFLPSMMLLATLVMHEAARRAMVQISMLANIILSMGNQFGAQNRLLVQLRLGRLCTPFHSLKF